MKIKHCICFKISLEKLKKIADDFNITTIEELQKKECFGLGCGMCLPYIEEMINPPGGAKVSTGLIDHKCCVSRMSSNRAKIDDKT